MPKPTPPPKQSPKKSKAAASPLPPSRPVQMVLVPGKVSNSGQGLPEFMLVPLGSPEAKTAGAPPARRKAPSKTRIYGGNKVLISGSMHPEGDGLLSVTADVRKQVKAE